MDDLWILLADPCERRHVDGVWGLGLWCLATERPVAPWIATEAALAGAVRAVAPDARLIVEPPDGLHSRLSRLSPERSGWLGLLWLRGALPEAWGEVRSFGLRAGILGVTAAGSAGRQHRAALLDPLPTWVEADGDLSTGDRADGLARGFRRRRWIRSLQAWVIDGCDVVEAPDAESARCLEALFLPAAGKVRVAGVMETPAWSGRIAPGIAVLGSTRHVGRNREFLRALAALREEGDSSAGGASRAEGAASVSWLADPASSSGVRALQDLRRLRLTETIFWQTDPWRHVFSAAVWPWSLMFVPDGRPLRRPLAAGFLSAGGTVVIPEGDPSDLRQTQTARGVAKPPDEHATGTIIEIPWDSSALTAALRDLLRAAPTSFSHPVPERR